QNGQPISQNGQPISKVFVKTILADKQLVSVTASHELFEMVIDPIANLWAEAADGTEYAYEMSGPVEEDNFLWIDSDVELRAPLMVRTVQASSWNEIRPSRAAYQAI